MEHDDLQHKLSLLDDELDRYSFDISSLTEDEKKKIKDLYTQMWKSYNNKIFIEDINKSNIKINEKILINGQQFGSHRITNKSTLHFINCKNLTIFVTTKVCHITNEGCENLTIKIIGGSVTGMDVIRCSHISLLIEDSSVHFLDISKSQDCIFYISEKNALCTTISSFESQSITITTTNPDEGTVKNVYKPNISFFEIYRLYSFEIENDLVQLYYMLPKKMNRFSTILDNKDKIIVKGEKY